MPRIVWGIDRDDLAAFLAELRRRLEDGSLLGRQLVPEDGGEVPYLQGAGAAAARRGRRVSRHETGRAGERARRRDAAGAGGGVPAASGGARVPAGARAGAGAGG